MRVGVGRAGSGGVRRATVRLKIGAQGTPEGRSFPGDLFESWHDIGKQMRVWQERVFPSAPGFRISTDASEVHPAQVNALWMSSFGWDPQDEGKVRTMLAHSMVVVSLWDDEGVTTEAGEARGKGESRLVGFARCISDGVFVAMVCDDGCVDPALQERGLGTVLLRTLVKEARRAGVSSVAVFPSREQQTRFYGKSGFRLAGDDYSMMRLADPSAIGWDSPVPRPRIPAAQIGIEEEDACLADDDPCILVAEPGPPLADRTKSIL